MTDIPHPNKPPHTHTGKARPSPETHPQSAPAQYDTIPTEHPRTAQDTFTVLPTTQSIFSRALVRLRHSVADRLWTRRAIAGITLLACLIATALHLKGDALDQHTKHSQDKHTHAETRPVGHATVGHIRSRVRHARRSAPSRTHRARTRPGGVATNVTSTQSKHPDITAPQPAGVVSSQGTQTTEQSGGGPFLP